MPVLPSLAAGSRRSLCPRARAPPRSALAALVPLALWRWTLLPSAAPGAA
ncbi:MAG: hypothetical protein R3A52_05505 [Polyangiales bacterium]